MISVDKPLPAREGWIPTILIPVTDIKTYIHTDIHTQTDKYDEIYLMISVDMPLPAREGWIPTILIPNRKTDRHTDRRTDRQTDN